MRNYSSRVVLAVWLSAGTGCAEMHPGSRAEDTAAGKPEAVSPNKPGETSRDEDVDAPATTGVDESANDPSAVAPASEAAAVRSASMHPITPPVAPLVHPTALAAAAQVVPMTTMPAQLPACDDALLVTGRLDANSSAVSAGFGNWLADTYLFSATSQGTASIWSSIQPLGNAYVYGYGFPFTVEALGEAEAPALGANRVAGMSLDDNALDDGRARVDIETAPGKRYLVTFKALIGSANQGSSWDYTLSFCPSGLKLAGKLQQER
jgi:hypothetical protein